MVSRAQLLALHLSEDQIERAVAAGILHRVFRGVYAVGHLAIGNLGWMQAAILACGSEAAISHGSAAALLGLTERIPTLTDVVGPRQRGRGIHGIRWHQAPLPNPDEVILRDGIACTTVARTLVDLAGVLGERSLRRLIEEAAVQRTLDVPAVDRILSRRRRRGAPKLRALLAPWRFSGEDPPKLRSRLEARLWPRLVEWGLPLPAPT